VRFETLGDRHLRRPSSCQLTILTSHVGVVHDLKD